MTSFRPLRPILLTVALTLTGTVLASTAGCGSSEESTASDFGGPSSGTQEPPAAPGFGDSNVEANDAGATSKLAFRGSPLCHVTEQTCMPDDDTTHRTVGTIACPSAQACRIGSKARLSGTKTEAPYCEAAPSAAVDEGGECTDQYDCGAGFDCVKQDEGKSVCRRYCCAGTCDRQTTASGGKTFCDIQTLVAEAVSGGPLKAPVCMPLKACKLLATGQCESHETCAIVTEQGDTGCVTNGAAAVGASCDEERCAAGLTCLGRPGGRQCYAMCKMAGSPSCASNQICETSAVFKDPGYGICKDL